MRQPPPTRTASAPPLRPPRVATPDGQSPTTLSTASWMAAGATPRTTSTITIEDNSKEKFALPPPTQIYPYIFVCLPQYTFMLCYLSNWYYLICLYCLCFASQAEKSQHIRSEKYFSLFSAPREMPGFHFSNICTCTFYFKIANKIYTKTFVKEQKIYPLFNKSVCVPLHRVPDAKSNSKVQNCE